MFKQSRVLAATLAVMLPVQAAGDEGRYVLPRAVVTSVGQNSPVMVVTDPRLPRQPVPASDGSDYLQTIPGFAAVRSGGTNGDPVFRGMFGSRLKLLANGGEMLGACPSRMDAPSSYIAPENYDLLTIIKGPQTVQWGPGNSAATVLFERNPEVFVDTNMRVNASMLIGSNRRLDRNLDAAFGNAMGYVRLIGSSSKSNDYSDGKGKRVPSRWDKWQGDVALGLTPSDSTLLELTLGSGDGEARYAGRGMDGTQFKRTHIGVRLLKELQGEYLQGVSAQFYYNYADHIMDNYGLRQPNSAAAMPNMRTAFASQVDRKTLGWRFKSDWQWGDTELVLGMDAQWNEHSVRRGPASQYKRQSRNKDAEFRQWGVFAESVWHLEPYERLVSGVRLDLHEAKDRRNTLCTGMGACLANPTADKARNTRLYSGFMRYEHDLSSLPVTLYAGVGHSERFPDYWELFSASNLPVGGGMKPTGFQPIAFATTKPEKTTQLDLGFHYEHNALSAWGSAYWGEIKDYILFSYSQGAMAMSSVSNIRARIFGGELGGSYRFAPLWKAELSLAYSWGGNLTNDRALPQMPPLEMRSSVTYEREDWSMSALWRLASAQHRVDEMRGNVTGKDFGPSSGFGVFSINAMYHLNARWLLSAGIDNLFDKNYSEHLNLAGNAGFGYADNPIRINEPGRTWWTRVDMRL